MTESSTLSKSPANTTSKSPSTTPAKAPASDRRLDSVARTVSVIRELASAGRPLGASELARRCALGKATVHRIAQTLVDEHFLRQDPESRRYSLGPDLAMLGRSALEAYDLRAEAQPVLKRLAEQTNLTVFLNTAGSSGLICIDHVASLSNINLDGQAGRVIDYHTCPSGYVFLAFGERQLLEHTLAGPLPRYASRTITEPDRLREVVAATAAAGFAIAADDLEDGVMSISAPIFDLHGVAHEAISVAGFTHSFADKQQQIRDLVVAAARSLSLQMPN